MMEVNTLLIGIILFLAAFTQSLAGFGVALISMALLPELMGIRMATPLVAIVSLVVDVAVLLRYREALDLHKIWRVVLAALVGTPVGVYFLSSVDEHLAMIILGIILAGYALYALLGLRLPRLEHPLWSYIAGLWGGMLGGAYNTSGPPVIVYADCRAWPRETFKSNLQGYFLVSSLATLASHALNGNLKSSVWDTFWWTLPFIVAGLLAGFGLDRWVKPEFFRRIVLILLVVMGIRLML